MKNIQIQLTGLLLLVGVVLLPTSMAGTTIATPSSPGACGQAVATYCTCLNDPGPPSSGTFMDHPTCPQQQMLINALNVCNAQKVNCN